MKKKPLILIGSGGHAKACIDVIENEARFYIYGIIEMIAFILIKY